MQSLTNHFVANFLILSKIQATSKQASSRDVHVKISAIKG